MNQRLSDWQSLGSPLIIGGIRWTLSPLGQKLLSTTELNLASLLSPETSVRVKHGPHRSVHRVELKSTVAYLKSSCIWTNRSWVRELLRGPKASLEFEKAQQLLALGIPTAVPLAWGVRDSLWPGESYLLTQEIPQTEQLNRYLEESCLGEPGALATGVNQAKTPVATGVNQAKTPVATGVNQDKTPVANAPGSPSSTALLRQRIATELGRCLAHLHRAGVTHDDLHPGNLLIRFESEAIRFYLLDLHDLGLGRELSWSRSLANLAVFNRWFLMRCSRTDRLRFWEAYRRERGWDQRLSLRVEAATWRSNEQFWLSRDGRCLRDNRYFQIVRAPGISGFAVKEIDRGFLQSLVGNPDAPFESTQNQFLKNSRSSTVIELEMPTPQGPRAMIFKRFRLRSGTDLLANAFRTSPAVRSWQMGHGLLERGLPTARPWLVLHRKRWGLKAEGYLLCEKIEAATDLASFVEKGTLEDRRRLLERLARLIRKLHQVKLSHRDLKAANLLVQADGTLTFIDLVGVRVEGAISRRTRVQNLTRLNASFLNSKTVSHTDRLRFLLLYLNAGLHRDTDWRSWWRSISEATSAKVLRNQKRGRPLA